MRITLGQLNPTVGAIAKNLEAIVKVIEDAKEDTLIIFPEMALTGYPLDDLAFDKELQRASLNGLIAIQSALLKKGDASEVLVGFLECKKNEHLPRNSVAWLSANELKKVNHKIALPTYGVFDEARLFLSGKQILKGVFQNETFSVLICADLWEHKGIALAQARQAKSDTLIVINGSPYEEGKQETREAVMKQTLKDTAAKTGVYLNMVGGQDDLIFDGASFVITNVGIVAQLPFFKESSLFFDTVKLPTGGAKISATLAREEELYTAAVVGLKDYTVKNGLKTIALGVSGGIDSALVAVMAADALGGENVFGYALPSTYSSEHSLNDARELMAAIGGHFKITSIEPMIEAFSSLSLEEVAAENLQARMRGVILMGMSNKYNHLVLAPGNKSEIAVGYSTLYGDTVGGYAPIKDIYKTDVVKLAKWRNIKEAIIPINSILKPPSAELSPNQRDTDKLPPYELLDAFLRDAIEGRASAHELASKYGEALTSELLRLLKRAEWKRRQYPLGPKLTSMAFGRDRFMPVTNKNYE